MITNGTAVLGLGSIGPLAAKPVMEGKAVLFKKFAGIDVFDIEVAENDVDRLVEVVAALEPTFGGINLEDIKAPDCFEVERKLRARMKIPVFHDDQHGTAIVVGAALSNALRVVNKSITEIKVVCSGAGRRRSPAWSCWLTWGCRARTSGCLTWPAWSTKAASNSWIRSKRSLPARPRRERLAKSFRTPMCFWACRRAVC